MDRNIITKADASALEQAAFLKLLGLLQAVQNNSQANWDASSTVSDTAYWRGSVDTVKHIIQLIESLYDDQS